MKKLILLALILAPACAFAQKFGHINSADIIQNMPEFTAAQNEIQAQQKTYETELKKMQDELQAKGAEFEKEMATLSENIKQRRQQELQDMYTRMQQFAQESQSNVQKLSNDKMQAIQEKVTKVIAEIGKAGGYIYIMDITAGIPYISETQSTDLTSQVKSKLGATGAKTTPAKK